MVDTIKFQSAEIGFDKVELDRAWMRPVKGLNVVMKPLGRSMNVRSLYPAKYPGQEEQPLYAWACCLLIGQKAGKDSPFSKGGEEGIALDAGSVFYVFEPPVMRETLMRAKSEHVPVRLSCMGKVERKSRKWGLVQAWQWQVELGNRAFDLPKTPHYALPMPDDSPLLLPAGFDTDLAGDAQE